MKPMKIQNDKSRYLALEIVLSYSQHWGFIPRLYFTLKCVAAVLLETEICPLSSESLFFPSWILDAFVAEFYMASCDEHYRLL